MHVPTGSRWHKNLLAQMVEQRPERPTRDFRKYLSPIRKPFGISVTKSRISMVGNWFMKKQ